MEKKKTQNNYNILIEKILSSNLLNRGYGTIKELTEEISENGIRYLQLGGYIHCGISPEFGETFKLNKTGKDLLYFYSDKISLKDRIMSFYITKILGCKFDL